MSVVIPTYRRNDRLRVGLSALCEQTLPDSEFEVLVVDDGSPEPAEPVVAEFADRLPVRVLRKENGGLATARNHGAAHATHDVLLFMDDDILACPEFLERHLAAHEAEDRVVALGSLPHPPDVPLDSLSWYLEDVKHWDLFERYGREEDIPLPPLNGNSSVRRRWFEEQGGYDAEGFASYGGEDTDLGYRLRRAGLKFVYVPEARGLHYHGKDFAGYLREMESSGEAIVALVDKHPEVRERVNLDIVSGRFADLGWDKRIRRLGRLVLARVPLLVSTMKALIRIGSGLGLRRPLAPLYYLVAHHHFALGMERVLQARPEPSPS